MPWQRWLLCAELDTTKDGGSRNSYSRRDRNRWNRHVVERCPCVGRRYGAGRRAKMSKRQAGVQITKDDYNDDRFPDEEEPVGTWQKASEEVLAQRKIRKAKRPPPRTAEEIQKFGVAAEPSSAAAGPAADASANPFANISLVAPAATSVPPAATGAFSFGVAPAASTSFKPTSSTSSDTNALVGTKRTRLVVAVGSKNPVKVNSVHAAFSLAFPTCFVDCVPYDVPSGVPDQPWGEVETRQGALARAQACHAAHEAARGTPADYAVGLEGGCLDEDLASAHPDVAGLGSSSFPSPSCFSSVVSCFAVLAVLKAGPSLQSPRWGIAKTATFALPNKIVKLMRGDPPMELGDADDKVFSDINSKQKGGTIGKVTKGLIDRTKYYEHALLCALAPFMHEESGLYGG